MKTASPIPRRRALVVANYLCLALMNALFYVAWTRADAGHGVDAAGLAALLVVAATFVPLHWRSGLWRLTHAAGEALDERQLEITHAALRVAYAWFTVVCLLIVLAHAVVYRLAPGLDFAISVPLAVSLIYLAHTLPGAVLAWTEREMPGDEA